REHSSRDKPSPVTDKENAIKPSLQITFSTFTVKNGEELKVEIPVAGHPAPKIEWKKDGQGVKETSRLEVSTTPSLTVLHIRHAARDAVTGDSILLTWEKPETDGGSEIDGYIVEKRDKEENEWITCTPSTGVEDTSYTVKRLTENAEYNFRICAMNVAGAGEYVELPGSVKAAEKLEAPEIELDIALRKIVNVRIDVPFKGVPAPTVTWKKDGNILKETSRVNVNIFDTSSQLVIKDATRTDVGVYEVTLTNSAGTTAAEIFVNVFERPGPPTDLSVDEVSADFVSLSWQPPQYTGGCEISNYVVEKRDTGSTIWQTVSATVARTSIKISRLTQGIEYQFHVAAENRYGRSHYVESEPVVAQFPFKPPDAPTNLHVVQASKSAMVIAWSKPDSDGGSPIIGYYLECKDQSSILWSKLNKSLVTETKFKVTSVEEGLVYEFRVCAENMAGVGPCSNASEPVVAPKIIKYFICDTLMSTLITKKNQLQRSQAFFFLVNFVKIKTP
uniref:Titin n=1 Tax=Monopterus albus TaxID=43700 RepID=A0A3Q3KDF7_MONAL